MVALNKLRNDEDFGLLLHEIGRELEATDVQLRTLDGRQLTVSQGKAQAMQDLLDAAQNARSWLEKYG